MGGEFWCAAGACGRAVWDGNWRPHSNFSEWVRSSVSTPSILTLSSKTPHEKHANADRQTQFQPLFA